MRQQLGRFGVPEGGGSVWAVFLIVAVASQALVASLSLVIANKTHEIGMLATLGLGPRSIRRAFVLLGGLLAVGGVVLGGGIGCLVAWALDRFQLLRLPEQVYVVDYVPFLLRYGSDLPVIFGSTLLVTAVASFTAGRKASELDPVPALRR